MNNEKVYLLTDGCAWEINKETGNEHPHTIEVVDIETGAVRYIRSGSKIIFLEGQITDIRTQKTYNEQTEKTLQGQRKVSSNRQDKPNRSKHKKESKG